MMQKTFLSTTGTGLARASNFSAESNANEEWQVTSLLPDQDVRCLSADPFKPNVVCAGTHRRGVLRSNDGGLTWREAGLAGRSIRALAISALERDVVYAGTMPPGMFVSRDGGARWRELESFRNIRSRWWWRSPAEPSLTAYIQSIALSPTNPKLIVVGIEAGAVVRSEDGGASWTDHRAGALRDCHTLVAHATEGDCFYEAGGTGAALSRDGGRTWNQPSKGLDRHYGWACAADPARADVWYVSASPVFSWSTWFVPPAHVDGRAQAAIFRASGGAWQKLGGGLPNPLNHMAYALLTDPAAPSHVYAGLANGDVWHSANRGDTWTRLPFNLTGIHRTLIML